MRTYNKGLGENNGGGGVMDTEDFAYMAAVALHGLAESMGPDELESLIWNQEKYSLKEVKAMIDEAYRRRLE